MFGPAFWWALVGLVLMFCELMLPGLILFFFGLGALITALLAWIVPMSLTVQMVVFGVASLVSLFGLRSVLKRVFSGRETATSEDALTEGLAGEQGTVTVPIAPGKPGKVMLHGTDWKAESDETLDNGKAVEVVGQRSLTLIVKSK